MDAIQATILNFRINNLRSIIKKRRDNVNIYLKNLNLNNIFFPKEKKSEFNTYHTFVIQVDRRDELKKFLEKKEWVLQFTTQYPFIYKIVQKI